MGREWFLLLFVLGSGALALWVALRFPALTPASYRATAIHLVAAVVIGSLLSPALRVVPGLPSELSVLVAVFAIGLPAITYMLLVGLWLVRLGATQAPAGR